MSIPVSPTQSHSRRTIPSRRQARGRNLLRRRGGLVALLKLLTAAHRSLGMLSERPIPPSISLPRRSLSSPSRSPTAADEVHNYGHARWSRCRFVETGIMLASCAWIVYEAVSRIVLHAISRCRHRSGLRRAAGLYCGGLQPLPHAGPHRRQHRSDALAADSLHFATDMWATLAVMLGLGPPTRASASPCPGWSSPTHRA